MLENERHHHLKLQMRIDELEKCVHQYQSDLAREQDNHHKSKITISELRGLVQAYGKHIVERDEEIESWQKKIHEQDEKLHVHQKNKQEMEQTLQARQTHIHKQDEQLQSYQTSIQDLEKQLTVHSNTIQDLNEELEAHKMKICGVERQLQTSESNRIVQFHKLKAKEMQIRTELNWEEDKVAQLTIEKEKLEKHTATAKGSLKTWWQADESKPSPCAHCHGTQDVFKKIRDLEKQISYGMNISFYKNLCMAHFHLFL